jgi:hypothetical protein
MCLFNKGADMLEEERIEDEGAQETEAAPESPQAEGEEVKPQKAVPKVPRGKFKKPEKADLASVKGKFAKLKEGPVKKQSLDRFAKKSKMDPRVMYAGVGVVVVLAVIFVIFAMSRGKKTHAAYIKARNAIKENRDMKKMLGLPPLEGCRPLKEGGNPSLVFGEHKNHKIVDIENTVSGTKAKGSFKARAIYHKNQWKMMRLEVTLEGGRPKVLLDKELTDKGLMRK